MAHAALQISEEMEKADLGTNTDTNDDISSKKNLPPVKPVKTKKTEIIPNMTVFKSIDEHTRNVSGDNLMSVERLVAFLCKVATTDLEKVRAFYVWICSNIRHRSEKQVNPQRSDAVSTLRQRSGSHVNLMSACCNEVSIPVVEIRGCTKGKNYKPDHEFSQGDSNHTWNAVHVNGEWRLIDCSWGCGYTDNHGKFQQKLDEFWFLTDPQDFVYDHFPADSVWQLLDKPINIDEFNKRPQFTKKARDLGLKLLSHMEPLITVEKEVTIKFSTDICPLSTITADLVSPEGKKVNSQRCITRNDEQTFEIRVVPPHTGQYILRLFGKTKDYQHAKLRNLIEYKLEVETCHDQKVVFPEHFYPWGPVPNYAEYGFASSIEKMSKFSTDKNEIIIKLDQSHKNTISLILEREYESREELKNFTMISAYEGGVNAHCRFPTSGYYRLNVYATKDLKTEQHELRPYLQQSLGEHSNKLQLCASFLIECTCTSRDKSKIYPKCYTNAVLKYECELLEPMDRELPSETYVTFRMKSPCLRDVFVCRTQTEKYQDARMESLGEITCTDNVFSGNIKTPSKGEKIHLSGSKIKPSTMLTVLYQYVTV